jgi:hypothetical protein
MTEQTHEYTAARIHREEEKKKKENCFKNFSKGTHQMILNTSASHGASGWIEKTEPTGTAKEFFKSKSAGAATILLNEHLRTKGVFCNCPVGLATAAFKGAFLWAHDDEPSNFTTLNFPPTDASNVGAFSQSDLVVMSLKANEGKGLSNSNLEKAVVQGKMPAQNIHQLIDVMEAYMHGSAFLFGEDSYLTQQLLGCGTTSPSTAHNTPHVSRWTHPSQPSFSTALTGQCTCTCSPACTTRRGETSLPAPSISGPIFPRSLVELSTKPSLPASSNKDSSARGTTTKRTATRRKTGLNTGVKTTKKGERRSLTLIYEGSTSYTTMRAGTRTSQGNTSTSSRRTPVGRKFATNSMDKVSAGATARRPIPTIRSP